MLLRLPMLCNLHYTIDTGWNMNSIDEAVLKIQHFVKEVTGEEPTLEEIAKALTAYFVMNEIKDFIEINRETDDL